MKESFEERHGDNISRLKLVLIVVCLLAIPVTFWVNHRDVGSVNNRVTKVESPCLRYGAKSHQCKAAFEQAVLTITHAEACAILRKAGLAIGNCAGARLAQEAQRGSERAATKRSAEGGDASQPGSTGHQQPGPPSGGHQGAGPHSGTNHPLPQNPSDVGSAPTQPKETGGNLDSPPVSESANDHLPEQASPKAEPPGLLSPTTDHLPEPVKPVVETVCSVADRVAHLC
jgi:hypothetical protein